jgi:hypothetical protein
MKLFTGLLRLCSITGLWWAALWYVLPLDLRTLSTPALLGLHAGPPLLTEAAWFAFKRLRALRVKKAKEAAEKTGETQKQAETEAARLAREEAMRHRRAHAECRALWLDVTKTPDWMADAPKQCTLSERAADEVRGSGSQAVLGGALQRIFEAILENGLLAWLPVYLIPGNDPDSDARRLEWLERAWRQAATVKVSGGEAPPRLGMLPGEGTVTARAITLFENNPELPALLLLGMGSPLADDAADEPEAPEAADDSPKQTAPGHAVVAALLSRPGLALPKDLEIAAVEERKKISAYAPYWERANVSVERPVPGWGGMPAKLLPVFLETLEPFATLHRAHPVLCPARGYLHALQRTIEDVLVDGGLRKIPEDQKPAEAESPGPPDLGWIVHNDGEGDAQDIAARYVRLTAGLSAAGCEMNVLEEANNLDEDHGDVGAARGALIMAEALIRAAQLQKPVLAAEFGEKDNVVIGLARPLPAGE